MKNNPFLMDESPPLFGSGCARKFPLFELEKEHLSTFVSTHPDIILGMSDMDDVGALSIGFDQVLIQSVDVIAPIPVSPYDFGAICAAHCLSDLYAKGVTPLTALNILFHSVSPYKPVQMNQILTGMMDKLREASVVLLGGHTINDNNLYCGLAVSGIARNKEIIFTKGAQVGDNLILTKPLGTGVVSLTVRNRTLEVFPLPIIEGMKTLNIALTKMKDKHLIHSCTDVTGAGLAGSLYNIASRASVEIEINAAKIPCYKEAWDNSANEEDGALFNRDYTRGIISFDHSVKKETRNLLFDPQTSGGLLMSVSPENTSQILGDVFSNNNSIEPVIIGKITSSKEPSIRIL